MTAERRVEVVRLGERGEPWTRVREDGQLESVYYVYETMRMHFGKTGRLRTPDTLPRMSWRDRLATWLHLKFWYYVDDRGLPVFDWEDDLGPPRRPGQVWHGFSASGGPFSAIWLSGSCAKLWKVDFEPGVGSLPLTKPHDLDWPAFLLKYHDLTLTVVHAPGSVVEVHEHWSDPHADVGEAIEASPIWEASTAEVGRVDGSTTIKMMSGMVANTLPLEQRSPTATRA